MLTGVFHLHEQQARQVMTPAPAVVTVDTSEDVETALRRCVSSGHTRLVVTEDENRDRVKGIVHANQLAQLLLAEGPQATLDGLVREVPIVPETKAAGRPAGRPPAPALVTRRRDRRDGRTAGIVTVEDIIEEVVGEIDDETDPQAGDVRRLANGDWFVRGHVAINDLDRPWARPARGLRRLQLRRGLRLRRARPAPEARRHRDARWLPIRVESVRENRIEAVRIRDRPVPRSETNGQS